jgi:hypothetical protein
MGDTFLIFEEPPYDSIVAELIYIPTSSEQSSLSLTSLPPFVVVFLIIAIMIEVKWNLNVVFFSF